MKKVKCIESAKGVGTISPIYAGNIYSVISESDKYYIIEDASAKEFPGGGASWRKSRFIDLDDDIPDTIKSVKTNQDIADWRIFAKVKPGECACAIPKKDCVYHRE
jgi:hypothetical protein